VVVYAGGTLCDSPGSMPKTEEDIASKILYCCEKILTRGEEKRREEDCQRRRGGGAYS
jgi:hypothetical protein